MKLRKKYKYKIDEIVIISDFQIAEELEEDIIFKILQYEYNPQKISEVLFMFLTAENYEIKYATTRYTLNGKIRVRLHK